jgi:hypothetical protein
MQIKLEELMCKVALSDCGCWMWLGHIAWNGYGLIRYMRGGRVIRVRAHRAFYVMFVGRLVRGLEIDHLCRNRWCVNPAHLEQVSGSVNRARGMNPAAQNARKIVCARGHALSGDNLYRRPDGRGRGCKSCRASANRARFTQQGGAV